MPEYPRLVCGVDVGANGGVAFIGKDFCEAYRMPQTRGELVGLFTEYGPFIDKALVEKVSASPQMGTVSAFSFGASYERPLAILAALGIRVDEIRPQAWQKALNIPAVKSQIVRRKKGETPLSKEARLANQRIRNTEQREHKHRLLERAQQLEPRVKITLYTCDAILIAHCAYRGTL